MSLIEPHYKQYFCSRNAPLSCDQLLQTAQEFPKAKFCLECGFPAILPAKAEIKGSQGNYQITRPLGYRGMGRLYLGKQLNDNQDVVIKEYLLPTRSFNPEERSQRQDTFVRVAGISQADGRNQDFRLSSPSEAIADQQGERCYTITQGNVKACQTLSQYLQEKRVMKANQVREVLNQALQTLQFLHTQKFRLPSGQVRQDLVHGNISLDSLLILGNNQQDFTIYLCDLALWERLFEPPSVTPPSIPNFQQDLKELGLVAFSLWAGRVDSPDPRDTQQWPDSDPSLKQFIYRLIGIDPPFASAEDARKALRKLPPEDQVNNKAAVVTPEQTEKFRKPLLILLAVLALLSIGGGIWYFLKFGSKTEGDDNDNKVFAQLVPTFADVNSLPIGDFTYTGEKFGAWSNVLNSRPINDRTLEELLTQPNPKVNAKYSYQPVISKNLKIISEPIEQVKNGKKQFAITSVIDNLADNLYAEPIAYDGLLVFVAFSKKEKNLPKALNGQITLEQLRQIYTGQIRNWSKLGPNFPDLPIVPLAPNEPEAEHQFIRLVLTKDNTQEQSKQRDQGEQRRKEDRRDIDHQLVATYRNTRKQQPTEVTQQQILNEFNQGRSGIISYSILGETWNQCAAYPLAIVNENNQSNQAILAPNGQPITPSDTICDKNNPLNVQAFIHETYPLAYPLDVVYPKNNSIPPAGRKFVGLLTTRQGQCLLSKAGLVPLQPIPEKYLMRSNDCKPVP